MPQDADDVVSDEVLLEAVRAFEAETESRRQDQRLQRVLSDALDTLIADGVTAESAARAAEDAAAAARAAEAEAEAEAQARASAARVAVEVATRRRADAVAAQQLVEVVRDVIRTSGGPQLRWRVLCERVRERTLAM